MFLKLDNQSYNLNHLLVRIPTIPRRFIFLVHQGSEYHFSFLDDQNLKRGSITITEHTVCIAFSKAAEQSEVLGHLGIDANEKNVTILGKQWSRAPVHRTGGGSRK